MGHCAIICTSFTALLAVAMIVVGTVMHIDLFPDIVEEKIDQNLVLRNGTDVFEKFLQAPVPIYYRFYFFNVTNMEEVNENGSQPILTEVGPYVYREEMQRKIIEWKHNISTIVYKEIRTYHFEPEGTNGSLEDIINHVNIASIGLLGSSKIDLLDHAYGLYMNGSNKTMLVETTPGPFVESHTVDQLLFKGYNMSGQLPPMPENVTNIACDYANNCIFGFYHGKNGSESSSFEIKTGDVGLNSSITGDKITESMKHYREMVAYGGHPKLSYWYNDTCNALNGTDGTQFPPEVNKNKGLYVFNTDVCRSLYLQYEKDVQVKDIAAYRYIIPQSVFASPDINPDNVCFFQSNSSVKCPFKGGVLPVESCHDEYPVAASAPHFYMASQEYQDKFRGLNPDKEKHETYLDIEPMTGTVVSAAKRLQINMKIEPNPDVKWLKFINETTIFPVFWAEEGAIIDQKNVDVLENQLMVPYKAGKWIIIAVIALGAVLLTVAIAAFIKILSMRGKIHMNLRQEMEKTSKSWNYGSTLEKNSETKTVQMDAVVKEAERK